MDRDRQAPPARRLIGPNAITRLAEVLGPAAAPAIFAQAQLLPYLQQPPEAMVDEGEVLALHQALHRSLGEDRALEIAGEAGVLTGRYLLQRRIPAPIRWLLPQLPASLAARLLLRAITAHAWTFAGSGTFSARSGRPCVLRIEHNPLCQGLQCSRPACTFFEAVFRVLFVALVHPQTEVRQTACESYGDSACVFELAWPAQSWISRS